MMHSYEKKYSLCFIVFCLFLLGAMPANSYAVESSPVSTRGLSLPDSNSRAQGSVSGFPTASESFTIEGYVYFPSYTPLYDQFVLLQKEGLCIVKVSTNSINSSYFDIWFGVSTGTAGEFSGPAFSMAYYNVRSEWHHIAATYDSSSEEKRLYFDGVWTGGSVITTTYTTPPSTNVIIGGVLTSSYSFDTRNYFADEVRVSSGIRYATNFTPPTSLFVTDVSTSGLWHFDEPSGSTTFYDDSSNNNMLIGSNGAVTFQNDVTVGFTVSPISGDTSESGTTATFTVQLTSEPTADVTTVVSSSDTGEGTVSPSSLVFNATNWDTTQTVMVTGVDDDVVDGNQAYTINLAPATSADSNYNGLDPSDVSVTNMDDDTAEAPAATNLMSWNGNLVADFGDTNGLYVYGSSWSQISTWGNVNQMVEWNDGSTDNLVVDFGNGRGLVYYNGNDWTPMTNWDDVAGMTVFGNTLAVDFGNGHGIWTYNGTWNNITGWDSANAMAELNDGSTDCLIVDFGSGRGTYSYNGTTWTKMTSWCDVKHMTVYNSGSNDIFAMDFGSGRGMYTYDGTWTKITGWDTAQNMIACGNNLAVDFGSGRGLFYYDGTWTKLTAWDTANDMTEWNDGSTSRLVVDFGNGSGLKSYDGTWATLTGWDNTIEMQGFVTNLGVDFGPGTGVYIYDGASWTKINDWSTGD